MLELSGTVERIVYSNPENGYVIFRLSKGKLKDTDTVVGAAPPLTEGQSVSVIGTWIEDKKYGRQFKAVEFVVENPKNKEGLIKFLSSGFLPGIGEVFAKKMVDLFGLDVLTVIREEPAKLREIQGLGIKKSIKLSRLLKEQGATAELISFLQSHGLTINRANKIIQAYGAEAPEVLKSNPYKLIQDIEGIGFKIADEIALKLGIPPTSNERVSAAMNFLLGKALSDGHVYLPKAELYSETEKLLERSDLDLEACLNSLVESDHVIQEGDRIYQSYWHRVESEVAELVMMLQSENFKNKDWADSIERMQENESFKFSESQIASIKLCLENKFSVLTGGPGTGKSTITRFLLKMFRGRGLRVKLCAPTGRAAQRLEECCNTEATTIHRLLKYDPTIKSFHYGKDTPLETDVLLCDESSMIDLPLARNLLQALSPQTRVIFIGDRDQLPPVGAGSFFEDLIESQLISVAKLSQIFRQSEGSGIIEAAAKINRGETIQDRKIGEDFFFIEEEDSQALQEKIVDLLANRLPKKYDFNPLSDIQVLSPMYRGIIGINELNLAVQARVNPQPSTKIKRNNFSWGIGDRLVVTKNNYEKEVFNGDLGTLIKADLIEESLVVEFDRGHKATFDFDECSDLQLAYTLSIHKSQGSEFPCVIIPLSLQHYMMLRRRLLYTAVTRAKKICVLVGSRRALDIATKNFQEQPRYTALKERMLSLR